MPICCPQYLFFWTSVALLTPETATELFLLFPIRLDGRSRAEVTPKRKYFFKNSLHRKFTLFLFVAHWGFSGRTGTHKQMFAHTWKS
jgi:hypothetical protein